MRELKNVKKHVISSSFSLLRWVGPPHFQVHARPIHHHVLDSTLYDKYKILLHVSLVTAVLSLQETTTWWLIIFHLKMLVTYHRNIYVANIYGQQPLYRTPQSLLHLFSVCLCICVCACVYMLVWESELTFATTELTKNLYLSSSYRHITSLISGAVKLLYMATFL